MAFTLNKDIPTEPKFSLTIAVGSQRVIATWFKKGRIRDAIK